MASNSHTQLLKPAPTLNQQPVLFPDGSERGGIPGFLLDMLLFMHCSGCLFHSLPGGWGEAAVCGFSLLPHTRTEENELLCEGAACGVAKLVSDN